MSHLLQLVFSGLTTGSIVALTALGFVTIYNVTGVLNFAQGEFIMVGAMMMAVLTAASVPWPMALLCSVGAATLLGIVVELLLRPVRRSGVITQVIVTIGLSIAIQGTALLLWGSTPRALPPFTDRPPFAVLGASLVPQAAWVIGITGVLVTLLNLFFQRTQLGAAVRACMANPAASRLVGISPAAMAMISFGLSAAVAGLGGVAIAPITGATYNMGLMLGLKGFVAAVLGGLHNAPLAVVGGFLVGLLEALGAGLIASGYKEALTFGLLLVVLFVRPGGLAGQPAGKRV